MDTYDILVIILGVTLAILLVLSIIAMFYAIKVLKALRHISEKAEHFAQNMESASEFFKKSAGPIAVTKILANIVDAMREKKGKKDK